MRNKAPSLRAVLTAFRSDFLVVLGLSLVVNLLMLVPSLYMLQVYDRVLISYSELTLLAVSVIALFLFGVMAMAEWLRSRVLVRAGVRFDAVVGTRIFHANFDAHRSQSPLASPRAFNDLLQVRQFITGPGVFAMLDTPWAPIYAVVAYLLHPVLGLAALVFMVVQALVAWISQRQAAPASEAASKAGLEVSRFLHSKLRNAEVMQALGMAAPLRKRWRERHGQALAVGSQAQAVTDRLQALSKFVRYSQQSLSLGVGALLVVQGEMSPGAMIAGNLLIARALAPIDQLVATWRGLAATRMAFDRLDALMQAFPGTPAGAETVADGEVGLRNVTATAAGRRAPILEDVSVTLPPGSLTVVLGPSGSGKSTLARVLLGAWPEVRGEVLIGGQPVDAISRDALSRHLGYLPQEVELLSGTLAENIARFGQVDSKQVIEAARLAGLHEMILRFPKGYDTPVGQAGEVLSGGQRQRIALARALYGNPPVLVLDEPNAHLDEAGEVALHRTLEQLRADGRTVLVVTHRPGALALADYLVLLQDGRVRMQGPRQTVLAQLGSTAGPAQPPAGPAALQPA